MDLSELIDRMLLAGNAMSQELQEIADDSDDAAPVSKANCLALISDWDAVLQEKPEFTGVEKVTAPEFKKVPENKMEEGEGIC